MKWNATKNVAHQHLVGAVMVALSVAGVASVSSLGAPDGDKDDKDVARPLLGRLVAVGIPGASALSAVGQFLPGGPIHDKPALAAFTQSGRVLDPVRILVGSSSNFGEALARSDQRPGSFLSINPLGDALVVPADFASEGGQASTLGGRVQIYTANNPAFLNSIQNPNAKTANFTGVSNPLGISINWAFGRLWPANAPTRLNEMGTSTILDPQGWGLAGAPNPNIGGVYAGELTNRGAFPPSTSQVIPGALNSAAVGTAFLGASPDGSRKAVFVVIEADGSIVQEHTLQGLDGLAPAGSIAPLIGRHYADSDAEEEERRVTPRLGVILNWSPTMVLYISEPFENRIAVLDIANDGMVFRVAGVRHIWSRSFDKPVDLAPAIVETDDPNFSSNTTLNEGSDFYVANRGNNTIVRMQQDGTVVAVRQVRLADGRLLGDARINGIATAYSAQEESAPPDKIWVTITGHIPGVYGSRGAVLELPTF